MPNFLKLAEPLFNPTTIGEAIYALIQGKLSNVQADIQANETLMATKLALMEAKLSRANQIVAELENVAGDLSVAFIPTGTINAFGDINAPPGWLLCDGAEYNRADYPTLYLIIGNAFGSSDHGVTNLKFNVPDFRGRFLRGANLETVTDPDSSTRTAMKIGGNTGNAIGSIQGSQHQSHNHGGSTPEGGDHFHYVGNISANKGRPVSSNNSIPQQYGYLFQPEFGVITVTDSLWHALSRANTASSMGGGPVHVHDINSDGGNETRPLNAYVNFIIKT